MKRQDEKKELKRDSWWERGTLFEKVLFERKDDGSDSLATKPFIIFHLENGEKVKQESFGDKGAAERAFGGGAA